LPMFVPRNVAAAFEPQPGSAVPPQIIASVINKTGPPEARMWTVQVEHISGGLVTAASLRNITLKLVSTPACSSPPRIVSVFPLPFNGLSAGKFTTTVTLDFSGCPAAARFTATVELNVNGASVSYNWQNQFR
jgi:hypothetical protein